MCSLTKIKADYLADINRAILSVEREGILVKELFVGKEILLEIGVTSITTPNTVVKLSE